MRALRVELRASRTLTAMMALIFGGGAASLLATLPGITGYLLAALLLALGWLAAWHRALLQASNSVRAIELLEDGSAVLELRNGRRLATAMAGRRYVSAGWVSLPVGGASGRSLLVLSDMLEPDSFRRVRLWALWGRWPAGSRPSAKG